MKIEQTVLANGLRVITARMPGFVSAAVGAFIGAGSRDEDAAENGIAHFLEHMAFKGTSTRSALQISAEIEMLGAYINAYTSTDITAYYAIGLKNAVPNFLAILGDVLTDSVFNPEDIEIERGVILEEIRRFLDDPNSVAYGGFSLTAYPGQALGRPILGPPEFISAATRDNFLSFVGRHYHTGNMVVTGAGDLNHAEFCSLVEEHFARLPTSPAIAASPREPARYVGGLHRNAEREFEQVTILLGFEGPGEADARHYAYSILASALGGGMSSPIFQEVRGKRGLAYAVGAHDHTGADHGLFNVYAGTGAEHVEECLRVVCQEIARAAAEGVTEADLTRAKNQYLVQVAQAQEQPFSLVRGLAEFLLRTGHLQTPEATIEAVRGVTAEAVREAAQRVVTSAPTLALVGPVPEGDYLGLVREALGARRSQP